MVEVEKLRVDDLGRVEDLARKTWPSTFKNILAPAQIDYMLNWMYNLATLEQQIQGGHIFYIYKEQNEDLGFIGVELNYKNTQKLRIHKLYVLPAAQGKGIGAKLIDFVEKNLALPYQQSHLHLNVNKYNKAVSFYKHLGFVTTHEEDIAIGNGFFMNDFVMEKTVH